MARKKKKESVEPQGKLQAKYHDTREYLEEVKGELKKVTWPTRKETLSTALAVVALVIIVAIYLGIADFVFSRLVGLILP